MILTNISTQSEMIQFNDILSISPITTIKTNIIEIKISNGSSLSDNLINDAKLIISTSFNILNSNKDYIIERNTNTIKILYKLQLLSNTIQYNNTNYFNKDEIYKSISNVLIDNYESNNNLFEFNYQNISSIFNAIENDKSYTFNSDEKTNKINFIIKLHNEVNNIDELVFETMYPSIVRLFISTNNFLENNPNFNGTITDSELNEYIADINIILHLFNYEYIFITQPEPEPEPEPMPEPEPSRT